MCPYHGLHQAQSQAETSLRSTFVTSVKPIPNSREIFTRNSDPSVPNCDHNFIALANSRKSHASSGRRILECIIEKVCYNLTQPIWVSRHAKPLRALNRHHDVLVFRNATVQLADVIHKH